jgi:predicted type IV restriction endonuclease
MGAPDVIYQLVKAFDNNLESYMNGSYNEAQLRQEFINPFFKALDWDVTNEAIKL